MDISLAVLSAGRADRTIPIGDEEFVIGRALACQLRIDDEGVDSRHCRIRRTGSNRVLVEDLDSLHGTLLNDRPIRRGEARDGDRLRVGPATLVLRIKEAAEANVPGREPDGRGTDDDRPRAGSRIVEVNGVLMVKLREDDLAEEGAVRRFADELRARVESGRARVVLDLGPVNHLSIGAIGLLIEVRDLCRARGGLLKLVRLHPPVVRGLAQLGLYDQFEVATDARVALEGSWPGAAPARALADTADAAPVRVRLVALLGKARGKTVEVGSSQFLIGRDSSCNLRPNSPAISRLHTAIERRDGRVFVRDLGAKNGTVLNGRVLPGVEAEVAHGDRLQVGPLLFAVALGDRDLAIDADETGDSNPWLIKDQGAQPEPSTLMIHPSTPLAPPPPPAAPAPHVAPAPPPSDATVLSPPAPTVVATAAPKTGPAPAPAVVEESPPPPTFSLSYEVLGEAMLITLLTTEMNEESDIAPLRYELFTLFERPSLPRRVVVSLSLVRLLSSRGVGVLLAHFQRLTRVGGSMRLCCALGDVARTLDEMRVPMLIDVFPTLGEAMAAPWA